MQKMSYARYMQQNAKANFEIQRKHSYETHSAKQTWQREVSTKTFAETLGSFRQIGSNHQMPAFINRKVKNLKPYTNHFKKANQASEAMGTTLKSKYTEKMYGNNSKNKYNFNCQSSTSENQVVSEIQDEIAPKNICLKQSEKKSLKEEDMGAKCPPNDLTGFKGFCQLSQKKYHSKNKPQIQCTSTKIPSNSALIKSPYQKVSEVSAYDQFLQHTNNKFSNAILQSYNKQCKVNKQIFRDTRSVWKQASGSNQGSGLRQKTQHLPNTSASIQNRVKNLKTIQRRSFGIMSSSVKKQSISTNIDNQKEQNNCPKKVAQSANFLPKVHLEEKWNLNTQQVIIMCQKSNSVASNFQESLQQIQKEQSSPSETSQQQQVETEIQEEKKTIADKPQQPLQSIQKNEVKIIKQDSTENVKKQHKRNEKNYTLKRDSLQDLNIRQPSKLLISRDTQSQLTNKQLNEKQISQPKNVSAFSYIVFEPSFSSNPKISKQQSVSNGTVKLYKDERILSSLNCKTVVQMASLTKIMTFIVCLETCQTLELDATVQTVRIGKFQSEINGTSAEIEEGEIYTVEQLYYGLMLPSGNDASLALAVWAGKKMLAKEVRNKKQERKAAKICLDFQQNGGINEKFVFKKKRCYERFINEMNKKARTLGMSKTVYANSHGLSNNLNKSCSFDLAILCEYAMKNAHFRKIVQTKEYEGQIKVEQIVESQEPNIEVEENSQSLKINSRKQQTAQIREQRRLDNVEHKKADQKDRQQESSSDSDSISDNRSEKSSNQKVEKIETTVYESRTVRWQNTHKLLERPEYIGIKTGITNTAGPCLASCVKFEKYNRFFIIIVLNSKKLSYRFKDTEILRKWISKKEHLKKSSSPEVKGPTQEKF